MSNAKLKKCAQDGGVEPIIEKERLCFCSSSSSKVTPPLDYSYCFDKIFLLVSFDEIEIICFTK